MQAHERAFTLRKQPCIDAGVVHAVILARAKKNGRPEGRPFHDPPRIKGARRSLR
jgi:hypothetical protein